MVVLIIIAVILVLCFFGGQAIYLYEFCQGSREYPGQLYFIILADVVILIVTMVRGTPHVKASFQRARSGARNRVREKEEIARLARSLEGENMHIQWLEELRNRELSKADIQRTFHFCRLMESLVGRELLLGSLAQVDAKHGVLDEIEALEKRMLDNGERCKDVGDIERCRYFMGLIKSPKFKKDLKALEKQCKEREMQRKREKRALILWRSLAVAAVLGLVTFFTTWFVRELPYMQLRSMISDRTLTAEMCRIDGEYYKALHSEKGREFVASELTKLHKEDDAEKALWLLCSQPNNIGSYSLCSSESFAQWIAEYIENNGKKEWMTLKNSFETACYSVDGYSVEIEFYLGYRGEQRDVMELVICDGKNRTFFSMDCYNNNGRWPVIE